MTIRDWFGKRRRPPKRRTPARPTESRVTTPEPPQPEDVTKERTQPEDVTKELMQPADVTPPPQPEDVTKEPEPTAEPSAAPAAETVAETILVTVHPAGEPNRGRADLTDSVAKAQGIVQGLVESGVKPEAVTVLRAREVSLAVSYQWTVEISDQGDGSSKQHSQNLPAQPPASRSERQPEPSPQHSSAASVGATKAGVLSRATGILQEITPEAPFQLRFDRVVWLGLWGASLLILAILLVASLSGGNAREFVIGQPSPFGTESTGSNVTARPTPGLPGASPSVSAPAPLPSCLQGTVNNCQCQDFATYGEAQKFFSAYPPPNRQTVDPDGDGFFCEWLPKVSPSPGQ